MSARAISDEPNAKEEISLGRIFQKVDELDKDVKAIIDKIDNRLQDKEEVNRMFARYDNQFKEQASFNKEIADKVSDNKDDTTAIVAAAKAKVEQLQLYGVIITIVLGAFAIYQAIAK